MNSNSIHIHHLDARYTVARGQEDVSSLQRRLDRIASEILAQTWDNSIIQASTSNEPICFIEKMEVNLDLDTSYEDDRLLADTWAHHLHEDVLQTLSRGGRGVIVFRDCAEFLASFLEDLLRDHAWEHWYYREFEHLRSLSLGQAVLKTLTDDGDVGRDALIELTRRNELDLLLAALSDTEVDAIVSQCLLPASSSIFLPAVHAEWDRTLQSFLTKGDFALTSVLSRDVARLYLYVLRDRPDLGPDVNLARFIQNSLKAQQIQAPASVTRRVFTGYGGIFLLAPAALEMELHDFLERSPYPGPSGMSKVELSLFLIALQCLGRKNLEQAQRDAGLALFAGLPTSPTASQIKEYTDALTPDMHETFKEDWQTHQKEIASRPGVFLLPKSTLSTIKDYSGEFSLSSHAPTFLSNREWDVALSGISSAILRQFALKLGAFADSSPDYLHQNFLESRAEIEILPDHIAVRFLTCPLQMVLRMAGFDHGSWTVPWLENRKLEFRFD